MIKRVKCTECDMTYDLEDSDIHGMECACREYEEEETNVDYSIGETVHDDGETITEITPMLEPIRKLKPISFYDNRLFLQVHIPVMLTTKLKGKTKKDYKIIKKEMVNTAFYVTNDKKLEHASALQGFDQPKFTVTNDERWKYADITKWIQSEEKTDVRKTYKLIEDTIKEFIDFSDEEYFTIITLWVFGTYISKIFSYYPYLDFFGTKGSAKSKMMSVLEKLSYNGQLVSSITTAVLYRLVEATGCTLLIDETEYLKNPKHERAEMLMTMLKTSYRTSARVPVNTRTSNQDWSPYFFDAGTCITLGHITGLDEVLEDRTIPVRMEITLKKNIGNTDPDIDMIESEWSDVRSGIYKVVLENISEIVELSKEKLERDDIGNRELNQIWKPLLVLAKFFEDHGVPDLTRKINKIITSTHEAKVDANREENPDVETLDYLIKYVIDEKKITPIEESKPDWYLQQSIFDTIKTYHDPEWLKSSKSLGTTLKRLGIQGKHTTKGRIVCISKTVLKDIATRFSINHDSLKDVKPNVL